MVVRAGLGDLVDVSPAWRSPGAAILSGAARTIVRLYHLLREVPIFRHLLLAAGPFLQIVGRKHA
jgi:hypothetical protein